jgi:hypothetical protein
MKNIHLLPTDKPSRLVKLKWFGKDKLHLCKVILPIENEEQYQHIYITSDEEIKEGDWYYYFGHIIKYEKDENTLTPNCKKIILTTDIDLIAEGVQSIDDEFLEWFVKNPSCEEVKVETFEVEDYVGFAGHTSYPTFHNKYKIIIPKQESKQIKCYCGHTITCDCEPLQETLEEAAERYVKSRWGLVSYPDIELSFIEGANWLAERMYSEEDLLSAFEAGMMFIGEDKGSFREWFEQQKKK